MEMSENSTQTWPDLNQEVEDMAYIKRQDGIALC